MRAVHVSTYDVVGGAARAAYRVHASLRAAGLDSRMLVRESRSGDPHVDVFRPAADWGSRIRRRVRRERLTRALARYAHSRPAGYEPFSTDRAEHGAEIAHRITAPGTVINLHSVANFLDYETFFPAVGSRSPIVWTLHDMNVFTGGCHYDAQCGRYAERCGACPQLGSRDEGDLSRSVWRRKRDLFTEQTRLHVVTPSQWLKGEVARSSVLGHASVSVIPYGLDVETFAPRDKQAARDVLGIPQDRKVVLFVADLVDNRRKGFRTLVQTLLEEEERATDLFLLSLGYNRPSLGLHTPWLHLGRIENDRILSMVYSAADVFVITSEQDNLPNTVLESLACGTPVVGVAVGGIPDMVRHERTGLLVAPDDTAGLRKAIRELCHDGARRADMSVNCRRIAVQEYSLEVQGRRYVDLYTSLF